MHRKMKKLGGNFQNINNGCLSVYSSPIVYKFSLISMYFFCIGKTLKKMVRVIHYHIISQANNLEIHRFVRLQDANSIQSIEVS